MPDPSGTYTLTGIIGSPITRETEVDAAVTYDIQGNADTFNITGDADSTVSINQTINVPDILNLTANGGTIELSDDQTNDTIVTTIKNGGSFITNGYLRGTESTGSVTFGDGGGVLVLGIVGTFRGGTLPQAINGFTSNNDVIDDQALKFSGITGYTIAAGSTNGQQVVTIDDASGTLTFTVGGSSLVDGNYDSLMTGPLDLFTDSTGGTNITVQSGLDQSGTYTLTGIAGLPISREAAPGAAVTYDINGDSDTFTITADAASTIAIDQTVYFADDLNLVADGGTISLSANQANDTIVTTIENDGSFVTNGYFGDTSPDGSVTFGVGGGSLVLGVSRNYHSATAAQTINDFNSTDDVIDDHTLEFAGITGYAIAAAAGNGEQLVTIDDSDGNFAFTTAGTSFALGSYQSLTGGPLHLLADSTGGTTLVACYCVGTRIATPTGEVAVQALRIGDLVTTLGGAARPIRWIGRRSYAGRFASGNRDVLPVTIRAGALNDQVPCNDLRVSPLHALFLDDMLIPAGALVNGLSIVQADRVEVVEYVHIELDTHDILLAEGVAAESFVDDDSRAMFHNVHEYHALYPDAVRQPARYYGRRVEHGPDLERLRLRLAARARGEAFAVAGSLVGHIDELSRDRIKGWALDTAAPDSPVRLRILDGGVVLCEVVADQFRADLAHAGHGKGLCAFDIAIPGGLDPERRHFIQVQRSSDWQNLGGSPCVLESELRTSTAPAAVAVAPALGWHGRLDMATRDQVRGWAQEGDALETAVALQVLCDGQPLARVVANIYRPDLERAGLGSGRHGFEIVIPGGLSPLERHVIQVRRESDGSELPGSPVVIEAAGSFDTSLEAAISQAVAAAGGVADQARIMGFMLEQADRLAQRMADMALDSDRPQVLFIDGHVPVATRDAGSQVVLSHMRAMQRLGYAVSLASPERVPEAPVIPGVRWLGAPLHDSVESILQRQAGRFDVVYLHRADVASRYMALVRQHMPRAHVLYNVADLHHVRVARQAQAEERPELLPASERLRLAETVAALLADAVLVHSPDEIATLGRLAPRARLYHVPMVTPVRSGAAPFGARSGVAFIGGYRHAPNVDAARVLVDEVMPLVWEQLPCLPCLLIGSDMPDRVRRLASPHVELVGQVADLGPVLERVRLTVAPLRYGAGVKGKVLESFAAAVPCVMSPIAAEGLVLPATLQALVGQDVRQIAQLIVRLHENEQVHRAVVESGLKLVDGCHREVQVDAVLEAALTVRNGCSSLWSSNVAIGGRLEVPLKSA